MVRTRLKQLSEDSIPVWAVFVRFVVGTDADNGFWLTGLFTIAREMRDCRELYRYESEWLEEVFDWFNVNLPCPPFAKNLRSGKWSQDAVCWFCDDAGEPLQRMWDLVALLREHDRLVRVLTTTKPGKIVYADAYQVVAEPLPWF
jgi:hypothetical protein